MSDYYYDKIYKEGPPHNFRQTYFLIHNILVVNYGWGPHQSAQVCHCKHTRGLHYPSSNQLKPAGDYSSDHLGQCSARSHCGCHKFRLKTDTRTAEEIAAALKPSTEPVEPIDTTQGLEAWF